MIKSPLFFILFFLFFTVYQCVATTYIGQNIEQNTLWAKANSPYIITIDVEVLEKVVLTIEAGTEVQFAKETKLIVSGSLVAKGVKNQRIIFSGFNNGDWKGFLFLKECNDYNSKTGEGVRFDYCDFVGNTVTPALLIHSHGCNIGIFNCNISDCYTAIQMDRQAEISVWNSSFSNCNRVVNVQNTSSLNMLHNTISACNSLILGGTSVLKNNIFKDFTNKGIHSGIVVWMLGGGIVEIQGNQFLNFENYAIKLFKTNHRSSFLVRENDFKNNTTNLSLSCKYFNQGISVIENNNFYNYKKYHIEVFSPCSDEEKEEIIHIGSNYWGKLSDKELQATILDKGLNNSIIATVKPAPMLKKSHKRITAFY